MSNLSTESQQTDRMSQTQKHVTENYHAAFAGGRNNIKQTSHVLWGSADLKMPIHAHFFRRVILIRKVGQTGLVFGVWSGFISRSVLERLHVSVWNGYDLCHPGYIGTHTHRDWHTAFVCLYEKLSQL